MPRKLLRRAAALLSTVAFGALAAASYPHGIFFVENRGQWPDEVLFMCPQSGLNTWITRHGVVYDLHRVVRPEGRAAAPSITGHVLRVMRQGGAAVQAAEPSGRLSGYHNYFIGDDPARHAALVPLYSEVLLRDAYPGIDVRYYADQGRLRYDYIVAPGADPSAIALAIHGADGWQAQGQQLALGTRFGPLHEGGLYCYQDRAGARARVDARFVADDGLARLRLGAYDPALPLVIDPLVFGTYLGAAGFDSADALVLDNLNRPVIAGSTYAGFPATTGAYDESYNDSGSTDAYVAKFQPNGTGLVFATYLGGSAPDAAFDLALDAQGNIFVIGETSSSNFPISPGAIDNAIVFKDAFIAKLNPGGSALLHATYFGGSSDDTGVGIGIDASGNVWAAGTTGSSNLPAGGATLYGSFQGWSDAWVARFNPLMSNLQYRTYLGGPGSEQLFGMHLDANGVYLVGRTYADGMPITSGAFDSQFEGYTEGFVGKLSPDGLSLVFLSYVGGQAADQAHAITADATGAVYLVGTTSSPNMTVTPDAIDAQCDGFSDAFLCKLSASGALLYATFLGGGAAEEGLAVALAADGRIFVGGHSNSQQPNPFPTTLGSFQPAFAGGGYDGFLAVLMPGGTLAYGSYIGGTGDDRLFLVAIDASGVPVMAGNTNSTNFPVTADAFDTQQNGNIDAFVVKLPACQASALDPVSNSPVCQGAQLLLSAASLPGVTYAWSGPGGFSASGTDVSVSNVQAGGYYVVSATGADLCIVLDSVLVNLLPAPDVGADIGGPVCIGQPLQLIGSVSPAGASFIWSGPGGYTSTQLSPLVGNATLAMSGTYTLTATSGDGCVASAAVEVQVVNCAGLPDGAGAHVRAWHMAEAGVLRIESPWPLRSMALHAADGSLVWQGSLAGQQAAIAMPACAPAIYHYRIETSGHGPVMGRLLVAP